jgi:hypothetical protein
VEQHVALLVAECVDGALGGRVARLGALEDPGDLRVRARPEDVVDGVEVAGRHQDDDLVDQRGGVEQPDGVLDDRLARDLDELLGDRQTDPRSRPSGQDDRYVPQSRHHWRVGGSRRGAAHD